MPVLLKLLLLAFIAIPLPAQAQAADQLRGSAPGAQIQAPVPVPLTVVNTSSVVFFDHFEIIGSTTFVSKTKKSLTLLEGSTTFIKISPYIAVIQEADHSGMVANAIKPTFQVGRTTWNNSAAWYAGDIAHDGYHSLLYHKAKGAGTAEPPEEAWTGKLAEQKCLAVQAEVLIEIKADKSLVTYVTNLITDPTYQNVAYGMRNW